MAGTKSLRPLSGWRAKTTIRKIYLANLMSLLAASAWPTTDLTFKIKFVLDSITHITQQQSQLLMYVRTRKKKQEQRNNNTYINNNLRRMALDGRIICIKREEAKCY